MARRPPAPLPRLGFEDWRVLVSEHGIRAADITWPDADEDAVVTVILRAWRHLDPAATRADVGALTLPEAQALLLQAVPLRGIWLEYLHELPLVPDTLRLALGMREGEQAGLAPRDALLLAKVVAPATRRWTAGDRTLHYCTDHSRPWHTPQEM